MKKKSQITIFIIIGIFILFMFFLIVFLSRLELVKLDPPSDVNDPINVFVLGCIEESVGISSFELGRNGGLSYKTPVNYMGSFNYLYINSPKSKTVIPRTRLIDEYKILINKNLLNCVDGFNYFKNMGYEVDYKGHEIEININYDYSEVDIFFDLTLKKDNQIKHVNNFPKIHVPLMIGRANELANHFIDFIYDNPTLTPQSSPMMSIHDSYLDIDGVNIVSLGVNTYWFEQKTKGEYEQLYNENKKFMYKFAALHN